MALKDTECQLFRHLAALWKGASIEPNRITLAGRSVARIGLSVSRLGRPGMWGEPADRGDGVAAIRRAVDLGVELIEVPAPFGPWADLVRTAAPTGALISVRLTGPGGLEAASRRLGPDLRVGLVVVQEGAEPPWDGPTAVRVGSGGGPPPDWAAAVSGPWPAPGGTAPASTGKPYLTDRMGALEQPGTVVLVAPRRAAEVDGLVTPPGGGPG